MISRKWAGVLSACRFMRFESFTAGARKAQFQLVPMSKGAIEKRADRKTLNDQISSIEEVKEEERKELC